MKYWQALSFTDPRHLIALARRCEQLGFEGVMLSDHLFVPAKLSSAYLYADNGAPPFDEHSPFPDPFATIGALAAVTERLRFSIGILIAPLREPLGLAKSAATLAVLSEGRFALGAGVGWMREEFDVLRLPFERRGQIFDEQIEVLRKLWRGGAVEHHGTFYDFPPLYLSPVPPAPIPIWLGGDSPPALRRAARVGDGWIGTPLDLTELERVLEQFAKLRREAGRERTPFEIVSAVNAPPDAGLYRRLEDKGLTAVISYPPGLALGTPAATLSQELDYLERYADGVIRKLG
jgi:probable F420-dependent oxidoreductase